MEKREIVKASRKTEASGAGLSTYFDGGGQRVDVLREPKKKPLSGNTLTLSKRGSRGDWRAAEPGKKAAQAPST